MIDYSTVLREMILDALQGEYIIKPNERSRYAEWKPTSRRYAGSPVYEIGLKNPMSPIRIFIYQDVPHGRILNNQLLNVIYMEFPSMYDELTKGLKKQDELDKLSEKLERELSEVIIWEKH